MNTRGMHRVRRIVRRVSGRPKAAALILLYHRVTTVQSDPFRIAVSPGHFTEHLDVLRKSHEVLGLERLLVCLSEKRLPQRSVVITFDDGYSDVLHAAKPLLESHGLPATVFVTSGFIGNAREPWWDELERLCLGDDQLPSTLNLTISGENLSWVNEEKMPSHGSSDRAGLPKWDFWQRDHESGRQKLFRVLYGKLKPLRPPARDEAIDALLSWARVGRISRESHRMMSVDELRTLVQGDLFTAGAHTVNHPTLASLSLQDRFDEMLNCKKRLEELLGRRVDTFAYPYGSPADYGQETVPLARQAGFRCACTNVANLVHSRTDLFELPRLEVRSWNGDKFAQVLREWLN